MPSAQSFPACEITPSVMNAPGKMNQKKWGEVARLTIASDATVASEPMDFR